MVGRGGSHDPCLAGVPRDPTVGASPHLSYSRRRAEPRVQASAEAVRRPCRGRRSGLPACRLREGGGSSSSTAQDPAQSPAQSSPTSNVTCDYPDAPQGATGNVYQAAVDTRRAGHGRRHHDHLDRHSRRDARRRQDAVHGELVRVAGQAGLLRQHPVPPADHDPATIFVLQCGDPTGTGTGGPGYTIPDELSGNETYGPGTLAMANTGSRTPAARSSSSSTRTRPCPRRTRCSARSTPAGLKAVQKVAEAGHRQRLRRRRRPPEGAGHHRQRHRSAETTRSASLLSVLDRGPELEGPADRAEPVGGLLDRPRQHLAGPVAALPLGERIATVTSRSTRWDPPSSRTLWPSTWTSNESGCGSLAGDQADVDRAYSRRARRAAAPPA